jgi:hypothetical protein
VSEMQEASSYYTMFMQNPTNIGWVLFMIVIELGVKWAGA